MLTTSASFNLITRNLDRSLGAVADQPQIRREVEYYRTKIADVRSIEDFLSDSRLFALAMSAHGLSDMIYAKAFMRKVLTEGIDDTSTFANQLTDPRFRDFASTFNFARYGGTATVFERARSGTIDRYVRATLEQQAGETDEGVRLALYFQRKAPQVSTVYGLLADGALARVVRTALGLSDMTAAADIDRQASQISARLDVADLKDPEKLAKFLRNFTVQWEIRNAPAVPAISALLPGQPVFAVIGTDALQKLQSLRRR